MQDLFGEIVGELKSKSIADELAMQIAKTLYAMVKNQREAEKKPYVQSGQFTPTDEYSFARKPRLGRPITEEEKAAWKLHHDSTSGSVIGRKIWANEPRISLKSEALATVLNMLESCKLTPERPIADPETAAQMEKLVKLRKRE